jgi:hypothetical protein
MAGHSRSQNGVASLAYVPAIPINRHRIPRLNGITRTRPVMTVEIAAPSRLIQAEAGSFCRMIRDSP